MACKSARLSLAVFACLEMAVFASNQSNITVQQHGASVSTPIPQISFVATTKQTALDAQPVKRTSERLQDILRHSRTFARAFPDPSDPEGYESTPKGTIVQSSEAIAGDSSVSAPSGLVDTIIEAYNHHHELVLRPDDVWQAVLTQFSFYVQAHAEELRDRIVDFQGKKELVVTAGGTLFTVDFRRLAREMVDEQIAQNIKDPSVAEWLLPSFSTTMNNDRVVASVSVMATLQAYFEYKFSLLCGIPRVTLLGRPQDWRDLRAKIDRLPEFDLEGGEMSKWRNLLALVLDNFVLSAEGQPSLSFWDRVASHESGGSGPDYLSGWVTVFAVFSDKGKWQGDVMLPEPCEDSDPENTCEAVGSTPWPRIDTDDIPVGSLAVPVLVDDNGVEYQTQMLVGQFAFDIVGDGKAVQSRSDWCIAMPEQASNIHIES